MIDQCYSVAQPLSLIHIMSHKYHGHTAIPDTLNQLPSFTSGIRIKTSS